MEKINQKIIIKDQEYDLPEGITPITDDGMYHVDWDLISCAEELEEGEVLTDEGEVRADTEFKFFNPRHLGQFGEKVGERFLGQGFDSASMQELLTDIKNSGLNYPLLGFWYIDEESKLIKVRINDGERRWRCINRLTSRKEQVWSKEHKRFVPANELYARIICRVETMTDEEAMERAYKVTNTSMKWGDAALARSIKHLYKIGKTDDQVCKMVGKSKLWVSDTYRLTELDDFSFTFLLEGKINRKCALDLLKIPDVEKRKKWLEDGWQDAMNTHEESKVKAEAAYDTALQKEEIAEAELAEAKFDNKDEATISELEEKVTEAAEKTKKRKEAKAASAKPMVRSKNLQRASGLKTALRPPKIQKKLKAVQELISKSDYTLADAKTLKIVASVYQCCLDGIDDIEEVLRKLSA
jgi:molybdopterin converting factor small subunit